MIQRKLDPIGTLRTLATKVPAARRRLLFVFLALLLLIVAAPLTYRFWFADPRVSLPQSKPAPVATAVGNELRFPPDAPQLAYLKITPVDNHPLPLVEPFAGRIAYDENRTVSLFAPVAGRVVRTLVQPGDQVTSGQPLVLLDVPDYADLTKANAALVTSRAAHSRAKALYEADVLSRRNLEETENQLKQAEAEEARAHTRLRYLRLTPQGVQLLAPQAGVIMERHATPGREVGPSSNEPLLVISQPSHVWVVAEISEQGLDKVSQGRPVVVTVDAYPSLSFKGEVEMIGKVIDPQTRRIQVRCSVDNRELLLKPEMFARIAPIDEGRNLPRLQNSALVTEGLKTFVFVQTQPGVLKKREVELALRGNGVSFVSTGLTAGEHVVSVGALLLNAELSGN